jgi:hypothetical protein
MVGRFGDRIPVGARFYAPVQTGPGTHSVSYTMDTESFAGVKRPGRGVNYNTYIAEVKERVDLNCSSIITTRTLVNLLTMLSMVTIKLAATLVTRVVTYVRLSSRERLIVV